jgi:hypothetical protein
MRGFKVGSAAQHGFEEARGLNDVKPAVLDHAIVNIDDNVAVPFNPGYMMNINSFGHGFSPHD